MKILKFLNQFVFLISLVLIIYAIILFQVSLASALLGLLLLPFIGWEQFLNAPIWQYVLEGLGYSLMLGLPAVVGFVICLIFNIYFEKDANETIC